MVLAANGATVKPATNLTNNGSWGTSSAKNVPRFYYPSIAATLNNRFGLAWERQVYDGSSYPTTTWYAVRSGDGGQVKAPTQFSSNTRSYYPNLSSLADGTLFLVQRTDSQYSATAGSTAAATSSPGSPRCRSPIPTTRTQSNCPTATS